MNAFGNAIGDSLASSMQSGTQGYGPASAADYRNGSDIESDNAYEARRYEEWADQNDDIMFRRGMDITRANSVRLADGSVQLPNGRKVSVSVGDAQPALAFAGGGGTFRGFGAYQDDAARRFAPGETLGQLSSATSRIDSRLLAFTPSGMTKLDGSPVTYTFDERTGQAYWDLGEDNVLRAIPKAFKQPTLAEAKLAPGNPFALAGQAGAILTDVGMLAVGGGLGLGASGLAARGVMAFAADTSAYGLRTAYMMNASAVNVLGVEATGLTLGYDAVSPSPLLFASGGRSAARFGNAEVGANPLGFGALRSPSELMGVEPASAELLAAVGAKRSLVIAKPGSEELRMLDYFGAEASVGGVNNSSILLRENPSKAAVLEEFLHGTQARLGIVDRLGNSGLGSAETHVKDFMMRHQQMLGLSNEDVRILKILRDKGL